MKKICLKVKGFSCSGNSRARLRKPALRSALGCRWILVTIGDLDVSKGCKPAVSPPVRMILVNLNHCAEDRDLSDSTIAR